MKYGLMYYKNTDNIGDDIQTYVAKRFLPHIDYYIDREDLSCFIPEKKEYVSMIMNGWFLHNKLAWPPSPYINPLLISMHFTSLESIDVGEKYLEGLGGDYLKQYGKIGCRDEETQKRLLSKSIDNYFSGCMTLTLNRFEGVTKKNYICTVDIEKEVLDKVKESTKMEIKNVTHIVNPSEISKKDIDTRMNDVEKLLKIYQASHLVLTSRLHVALPCIALGTPVILIHKEKFEEDRLGTFLKFMYSYSDKEFMKLDIKELLKNPKNNKIDYIKIRDSLIKTCEDFIDNCEHGIVQYKELPEIEEYREYVKKIKWYKELHEKVRVKSKNNIYNFEEQYQKDKRKIELLNDTIHNLTIKCHELENERNNLSNEKDNLKKELENVYNSKGWQMIDKCRRIKKNLKMRGKNK